MQYVPSLQRYTAGRAAQPQIAAAAAASSTAPAGSKPTNNKSRGPFEMRPSRVMKDHAVGSSGASPSRQRSGRHAAKKQRQQEDGAKEEEAAEREEDEQQEEEHADADRSTEQRAANMCSVLEATTIRASAAAAGSSSAALLLPASDGWKLRVVTHGLAKQLGNTAILSQTLPSSAAFTWANAEEGAEGEGEGDGGRAGSDAEQDASTANAGGAISAANAKGNRRKGRKKKTIFSVRRKRRTVGVAGGDEETGQPVGAGQPDGGAAAAEADAEAETAEMIEQQEQMMLTRQPWRPVRPTFEIRLPFATMSDALDQAAAGQTRLVDLHDATRAMTALARFRHEVRKARQREQKRRHGDARRRQANAEALLARSKQDQEQLRRRQASLSAAHLSQHQRYADAIQLGGMMHQQQQQINGSDHAMADGTAMYGASMPKAGGDGGVPGAADLSAELHAAKEAEQAAEEQIATTTETIKTLAEAIVQSDEKLREQLDALTLLSFIQQFIGQLAKRAVVAGPAPELSREKDAAQEKRGDADDDTTVKREEGVEAMVLSLARADDAKLQQKHNEPQPEETTDESRRQFGQYALHMRLTGGDYFSNAIYMDEQDALNLDTGEADLVKIHPSSKPGATPRHVPTLGQRLLRPAGHRRYHQHQQQRGTAIPGSTNATTAAGASGASRGTAVTPAMKAPSYLYYGPYESFAPTHDSSEATMSYGAALVARQAKIDPTTLRLLRRWAGADPDRLLSELEADDEEELYDGEDDEAEAEETAAMTAPPPPERLPDDLLKSLGSEFDPAAIQAAYEQAFFKERIDERLRDNMHIIGKLQQVQWERLRVHEAEYKRDQLGAEPEAHLVATERESELAESLLDSLTDLIAMRPQGLTKRGKLRGIVPRASKLEAAISSSVIDPALLEGDEAAPAGYWGTMPSTTHRKMPRVLRDSMTARQIDSSEAHYRNKYAARTAAIRFSNKGLLSEVAATRDYSRGGVPEEIRQGPAQSPAELARAGAAAPQRPNVVPRQSSTLARPPIHAMAAAVAATRPVGGGVSMGNLVVPGTVPSSTPGSGRNPFANMPALHRSGSGASPGGGAGGNGSPYGSPLPGAQMPGPGRTASAGFAPNYVPPRVQQTPGQPSYVGPQHPQQHLLNGARSYYHGTPQAGR